MEQSSYPRWIRSPWILLAVVLGANLLFLNQAFHIDDRIYLEIADQVLEDPLHPYDYPPLFEGLLTPDAASHSRLPLTSYYLALVGLLAASRQEWVYHAAFLVFPLLGAWGFYGIARRWVSHPLAAACLLAFSPGFFVLGHTLMTDVPLLSLWLITLHLFLKLAHGEDCRRDWVLCGLGLSAAAFVSLLSLGLVLLMAVYLWAREDLPPGKARNWRILLLLPFCIWLLWYLRAWLHYDRLVLVNTFLHMEKRAIFEAGTLGVKALSLVLNLGGAVIFPLALWCGFWGRVSARLYLLLFFWSFVPFYLWFPDWPWNSICLFALFFSTGLAVLWHALVRGARLLLLLLAGWALTGFGRLARSWGELRPLEEGAGNGAAGTTLRPADRLLLSCWFWGIVLICLAAFYAGSVRYTLPLAPVVILWWMQSLERRIESAYFLRNLVWAAVVATALCSLLLGHADYAFASMYRRQAEEITRASTGPGRVWFTAEWGFRYYLEQNGARPVSRTSTRPEAGDWIVKPRLASPWVTLYDRDEYLELAERRRARAKSPLRLLDFSSRAGFYSTGWGVLPFGLSAGGEWETFNIFRVKKKYDGPVPGSERHY